MITEMTTTARGTQTPRLRGANLDRISARTKRAVWGTWTPGQSNEERDMERARTAANVAEEMDLGIDGDSAEDLLNLVPVTEPKLYRGQAATERQVAFLSKLADERGVIVIVNDLTKSEASAKIEELLAMPRPTRPTTPTTELEDGVYAKDGEVFMVKHAIHGSGRQYASKLMPAEAIGQAGEWVYQGAKPLATLTAEMRLTRDMAQAYGAVYGCCVRCGRALTDPESIARSVGSTCWGKF